MRCNQRLAQEVQSSQRGRLAHYLPLLNSILLCCLLYTVVVRINYEAAMPNDVKDYIGQSVTSNMDGNTLRRVSYLIVFSTVITTAFIKNFNVIFRAISVPYIIACTWCVVSCVWAIDPSASLRRSINTIIILISAAVLVRFLGPKQTLRVLYYFLMFTLIASVAAVVLSSVPIFSFAVHPPNESDATLVGNWRGIFWHKNVAGPMMVISMLVFLHFALNRKKTVDWILLAGSMVFLLGTRSKTALGLAFVVIVIGMLYRSMASKRSGNTLFALLFLYLLVTIIVLGIVDYEQIYTFFTNPENLSGRVAIWISLWSYIKDHIWFGSGYGSFWGIGYQSPIFSLAISQFVLEVTQSHNGYLEALTTTGLIGLTLAIFSLVILPFVRILNGRREDSPLYALCLSIWLFGVLQNFTEAQFFSPDRQVWIFVVIAISIVHNNEMSRLRKRDAMRSLLLRKRPFVPLLSKRSGAKHELYQTP
ncbi:MAG TPA: O-antigen ligase family protein [Methylocella sp.]